MRDALIQRNITIYRPLPSNPRTHRCRRHVGRRGRRGRHRHRSARHQRSRRPRAPAFRAPSRPLWRHINRLERVGFVQKDPCISKLGQAAIHVVPLALLRSAVVDANSTQNPRRIAQLSRGTHARLAQCIRAEALQKGLFRLRCRARVRSSSAPVLRDLPYIRLLAFVLVPRRLVGSIGEETSGHRICRLWVHLLHAR